MDDRIVPPTDAPIPVSEAVANGPITGATTPLLGRDALVSTIVSRVADPSVRLLTLTGTGGIGKTRLAIEVAEEMASAFRDGVSILRFASVSDPAMVTLTVAHALNVRDPDSDGAWALARDRHCLLVLDNLEQLMPAAPGLVEMLTHCPEVTLLITSRQPLRVSGEHEYPVPALETPRDDTAADPLALGAIDAVRLFVQRATAVKPDFQLSWENAAPVARICRMLDGLPLAIELAAAWIDQYTPQTIADRLEATTDFLRGGPEERPPHQRSLRDTIAWSYNLLNDEERIAFCRLAVFAGGFLAPAAAYVCQVSHVLPPIDEPERFDQAELAMLDICGALVDKNLIYKAGDEEGEPRFAMLRTIRGFALDELRDSGDWDDTAKRHAAWYDTRARSAEAAMGKRSQSQWLSRLDYDAANLRAAAGMAPGSRGAWIAGQDVPRPGSVLAPARPRCRGQTVDRRRPCRRSRARRRSPAGDGCALPGGMARRSPRSPGRRPTAGRSEPGHCPRPWTSAAPNGFGAAAAG